jgi:Caspase domain
MRGRFSFRAIAAMIIATLSAPARIAQAADHFDVYFVTVGSTYYATSATPDQHGFAQLRGANKSARAMAERFQRAGARFGVVLTSEDGRFISLPDIRSAIDRVTAAVRAEKPSLPLLLFYFAGHGISEGVGWNHFSVPGTFVYRGKLAQMNPESLSKKTLHAAALADRLDRLKLPYVVMLDTCYEGTPVDFQSPVLTAPAIESLRNVAAILRFTNEFHQSNPVLFSTAPGTLVPTAPDPTDPQSDPVAPLARRAMILLDATSKAGRDLTLASFTQQMGAVELDRQTTPAITHAQPVPQWRRSVFFSGSGAGKVETRVGTAAAGEVCCDVNGSR